MVVFHVSTFILQLHFGGRWFSFSVQLSVFGCFAFDLFQHPANKGESQEEGQHVGHSLDRGNAVGAKHPGQGIDDGEEAAALARGGQQQSALGFAQAGTEHIDHRHPGMNGQSDAL